MPPSSLVVVADANGSQSAHHLCMDSRLGKAGTYLARRDIPDRVRGRLRTSTLARQTGLIP
ncbi:hypothetical protein ACIQNI_03325 [Streptomyces sp. NPDC091266]|uniref:hypothetical protein n=1 Tax=Streptomyces sp. NPDC091266 TaxID=3365978 RepID=UPI00380D51F2